MKPGLALEAVSDRLRAGGLLVLCLAGCTGPPSDPMQVASTSAAATSLATSESRQVEVELPSSTTTAVPDGVITVGENPNGSSRHAPGIAEAIDTARPGDTIWISPGVYPAVTITGREDLRLRKWPDLPGAVVIADGAYDRRAAVHIEDSRGIAIEGLELTTSLWGVMVVGSSDVDLVGLTVRDIGQEAIHIRDFSQSALIEDCTIFDTGRRPGGSGDYGYEQNGEGIYLGTGGPVDNFDVTTDVVIRNNEIYNTTAEAIDIKSSVLRVLIEDNRIHDVATNTSGAVVLGVGRRTYPDPEVTITGNYVWNISTVTPYTDGNAIRLSAQATVTNNVIWNVEHHGVLADGDFVTSEARTVTVTNNALLFAGRSGFDAWTSPNPAEVVSSGNLEDVPEAPSADVLLDQQGRPSMVAEQLLEALG